MPFAKKRKSSSSGSSGGRGFAAAARKRSASASATPKPASTPAAAYDTASVQHQIDNARMRLADAGVDVDKDVDSRNWFEKMTNLPQHQNWFFDALELLGRPSQAVLGATSAYQHNESGGDILKEAGQGFRGLRRTRGSQIVKDAGVDNKLAQAIAGFGLEVGFDPVSYIPGAAFAKVGKVAGGAAKAGASAAYRTAEKIPQFGRVSDTALRPAAAKVKDTLGFGFRRNYKLDETLNGGTDDTLVRRVRDNENQKRYLQENSLKGITDSARAAGGLKTGEQVGRLMEAPLRQFDEVPAYELPGGVGTTTSKRELLNQIEGRKNVVTDLNKESKNAIYTPKSHDQLTVGDKVYKLDLPKSKSLDQLSVGDKVYKLDAQGKRVKDAKQRSIAEVRQANGVKEFKLKGDNKFIPASSARPVAGQAKRLKGAKTQAIAEIRKTANGKEFRLEGESAFHPPTAIQPQGVVRTTALGDLNKQIGATVDELNRVEGQIRKSYFSKENSAIRQIAGRKNKPVNIDEVAQSRAFAQVGASPAFNLLLKQRGEIQSGLADLRKQAADLKTGNADQINKLNGEIDEIKAAADNPVIGQREIARRPRELSKEPAVRQAARTLTTSNELIRNYAKQNGIKIPEMEGYMTHVLSKAEREARDRRKVRHVDAGAYNKGNPNKKVLNPRQLAGSVEDVNEQTGRTFFEPNAYFATAVGQKRLIEYIQAVKMRREVLSNPNFARTFKKGDDIGPNQVVIDSNNYKFIRDGEEAPGTLADSIGGQYVVTKSVKNVLDRYQKATTDEGTKGIIKAFDAATNQWKKFALFSPMYHVRNMVGAMFNNYVGGMNVASLTKYTGLGIKEVTDALRGKPSALFDEFRRQGLTAEAMSNVEFLRSVDPEKQIEKIVRDQSKTVKRKALDRVNPLRAFETSREAGQIVDQTNRVAMYKWARDKGFTPEQAAAKVRETQFDYTDLAPFEKDVLTRVVPFYRWMRFNIPFQLERFISDPRKYAHANKLRLNAGSAVGLDEETQPDYLKESFTFPVSGNGESGQLLGLNLPLGDLTHLTHPLKTLVDSASPLLKLPIEEVVNRNLFFDSPIKKFEGQKTEYGIPGAGSVGVDPMLAYALEQLSGQPGRYATNLLKIENASDQERALTQPTQGISGFTKPYDVNKYEYYKMLDELQKYLDYIKYVEQSGNEVRDVRTIQKAR